MNNEMQFQSTHPVRGATADALQRQATIQISIHAPREGCDTIRKNTQIRYAISIHAPREGCDDSKIAMRNMYRISIHAPREGCDRRTHRKNRTNHNFNPRTP